MPFRFGVVTLTRSPQAFARVRIRLADGRVGEGMAAELLAPKWFDKNPALSNEDNFEQLRAALGIARDALPRRPRRQRLRPVRAPLPGAARSRRRARPERPGRALRPGALDRALLDALCRALGLPFHEAVQRNLVGLGATDLCPDLAGFDFDAFLARLSRRRRSPPATPSAWSTRSPATTRPSGSATACRKRWRRSSPPTASAGSSSRSRATSRPTSSGWRASPACSTGSMAAIAAASTATSSTTTSRACSRSGGGCDAEPRLAAAVRERRLRRAADQAADRARARRWRPVGRDTGHRRRVRRLARRLRPRAAPGLSRRLLEDLQGHLQVARSTLPAATSGTARRPAAT